MENYGSPDQVRDGQASPSSPAEKEWAPSVVTSSSSDHPRTISILTFGDSEPENPFAASEEPDTENEEASATPAAAASHWSAKLLLLLSAACVMLMMGMLGPMIAERVQYAITRGKQRAEYEFASRELEKSQIPLTEISKACQLVSRRISPSVVHIDTIERSVVPDLIESPFERQANGQGSGVIVDAKGYVITNYHVVRGARQIVVGLSDGRPIPGEVLAFDAPTDIAVLKINADNLIPAEWGDSDELEIGSLVWAAGSPFGLDHSVTFGTLSGKNRGGLAGTAHQNFLQTDVAVNPGNSGGPLVDSRGRVVGINTAIVGQSFQGISFAIPSNVVRHIYTRLLEKGKVDRGWLGVRLDAVSREVAIAQGLPAPRGAVVMSLTSEFGHASPAEAAGVKVGDIIIRWDDREVSGPAQLIQMISNTAAGSSVKLEVLRNGVRHELTVVIGARPAELN